MNAVLEKLLRYAAGGTDKTDKTPLQARILINTDSCVSFVSEFPGAFAEKTLDAEAILERAAIMEFDGELPRVDAERMAATEADARRTQGTAAEAEAWQSYIQAWHPDTPGDLPQPPPTSAGWPLWWERIGQCTEC